jgi:hypothetical protein
MDQVDDTTSDRLIQHPVINESLKNQLNILVDVVQTLKQSSCYPFMEQIAARRDRIVEGANSMDGSDVVDIIEPHLEKFYLLACAERTELLFSEAQQKLKSTTTSDEDQNKPSTKVLTSITEMSVCLATLVEFSAEKNALHRAMNADDGGHH